MENFENFINLVNGKSLLDVLRVYYGLKQSELISTVLEQACEEIGNGFDESFPTILRLNYKQTCKVEILCLHQKYDGNGLFKISFIDVNGKENSLELDWFYEE